MVEVVATAVAVREGKFYRHSGEAKLTRLPATPAVEVATNQVADTLEEAAVDTKVVEVDMVEEVSVQVHKIPRAVLY